LSYVNIKVVGYAGKEPHFSYRKDGKAQLEFSIAHTRKWTDQATQQKHEITTWFEVALIGVQAEVMRTEIHKGKQYLVEGDSLKTSTYTSKQDGKQHVKLHLRATLVAPVGEQSGGYGSEYVTAEDLW
jgi:single stranded DNA-binding protein